MAEQRVPHALLQQRIRNRLIDYFEIASSLDLIASFGAFEIINMWDDLVVDPEFSDEPVFSPFERKAIQVIGEILSRCAAETEQDVFCASTLAKSQSWQQLRDAATAALSEFQKRGRFPNDTVEILT